MQRGPKVKDKTTRHLNEGVGNSRPRDIEDGVARWEARPYGTEVKGSDEVKKESTRTTTRH
jgi:hypothetical protein